MKALRRLSGEAVVLLLATVIFLVPFALMLLTAVKDQTQAIDLDFAWPTSWPVVENFMAVIEARDYVLLRAYVNSTIITVASVALLVVFGAMAAFVLQRRPAGWPGWRTSWCCPG
ncbi:hypothetical protein ACFQ0B_53280 [Nonomuraea thailandensis]